MATKKALLEIRAIVEDIKTNKKKHKQEEYHSSCDTPHCIAGWKLVQDLLAIGVEPVYVWNEELGVLLLDNSPWPGNAWSHAEMQWGLTDREATCLFAPHLTLEEIEENLEQLELYYADSH